LSTPDDTKKKSEQDIARENEMEAMLERRFRHVDREHPAMAILWKEARRHWMESLKDADDG
jgi:hypothetical protein